MHASSNGLRISGIASAVPENKVTVQDKHPFFSEDELTKIAKNTGIYARHLSSSLCTSDLCCAAAESLLEHLNLSPSTIDVLIFISQTPDYVLPATSCTLQARLGLSKTCAAFDVNLGCSGYVYGLWLAGSLLNNPSTQRVLLLVGDTINRLTSPKDRAVTALFGDAGTATLIERDKNSNNSWFFSLGTNGLGSNNLIVPAGGFRSRTKQISTAPQEVNIRSEADLYMNGSEIFTFTLEEVPKLIASTLEQASWTMEDVHTFIFHQANQFMLQHLMKRLKIPAEKLMMSLEKFGNTNSASIPITISANLSQSIEQCMQVLLVGFGVGYSWGAAALQLDSEIVLPPMIYVPEPNCD
jgi:3-oxoacyl-[acyl-carrier-protein] synthase-3